MIDIAVRSLFERELERAYAESVSEEDQFRAFESVSADASKTIRRGEIWWFATLDPAPGSDIRKRRPVVVVSNDAGNRASGLVTVVPLTSNLERIYPFEVLLKAAATGLGRDSKACAQQIRTLSKIRLDEKRAGAVAAVDMLALDAALRLHLALG